MAAEEVARIRNIAIVGHGGTGKTYLADALVFAAGATNRLGKVDDGSSLFDFEPEDSVDWLLCDMAWRPLEVAAVAVGTLQTCSGRVWRRLLETAAGLVRKVLPPPPANMPELLKAAMRDLNSYGIVGVVEPGVDERQIALYRAVHDAGDPPAPRPREKAQASSGR